MPLLRLPRLRADIQLVRATLRNFDHAYGLTALAGPIPRSTEARALRGVGPRTSLLIALRELVDHLREIDEAAFRAAEAHDPWTLKP